MKIFLILTIVILFYCSGFCQTFTPGSRIEFDLGGNWYKGTVLAVKGDFYNIGFKVDGESSTAWMAKKRLRALPDNGSSNYPTPAKPATGFTAGSKVEINEFGKWHKGNIVEVKADQYKVHYDGYSERFDVWVTKDKVRPVSGGYNNPNPSLNNTPIETSISSASKAGEYYSGYSFGLGQTYYYLLPNGRVVYGCIEGGLEYYDVNAGCAKSPGDCGTYSKNGNTITVTWRNGERYTGTLNGRTIENMNATNFVKVYQVPNQLSANYSSGFTGGGVTGVVAYQFRDDGKFIFDKISGYDHGDGRWGAETASDKKGTYKINGYSITLTFNNGAKERHTIYALEANRNPSSLGWDCGFLDKAK